MSKTWVRGACSFELATVAFASLCLACGNVTPTGDAAMGSDSALAPLQLTSSPSSFVLHANDSRDVLFTITNPTSQMSGTPMLAATGLTLGMISFPISANLCTPLAPGASCTIVGHLKATVAGQITFDVTASASSVGSATTSLPMTVMPGCPASCGPNGSSNCCESSVVPGNATGATLAGEQFYRFYDVASDNAFPLDPANAATVSDFRLDTYEVTVGRFRAFVNAGMGTASTAPPAGAGAHTKIPGSGWDPGWNSNLPADTATLTASLKCSSTRQSWTDAAGANEGLPINCLTWYEAFAFCIWDGGYLPTQAEWNYAASGGSEHRAYPWANPASSLAIDCTNANYYVSPTVTYCVNGATGATNRVGTESPKGDSRWGQADIGGNALEWNLDWYASPLPTPCDDCANLATGTYHVVSGGSFFSSKDGLRPPAYNQEVGVYPFVDGVRCARVP